MKQVLETLSVITLLAVIVLCVTATFCLLRYDARQEELHKNMREARRYSEEAVRDLLRDLNYDQ